MTIPWFYYKIALPVFRIQNAAGEGPFYYFHKNHNYLPMFFTKDARTGATIACTPNQLRIIEEDKLANPGFYYGFAYSKLKGVSQFVCTKEIQIWLEEHGFRLKLFMADRILWKSADADLFEEVLFARRKPLTVGGFTWPWPPRDPVETECMLVLMEEAQKKVDEEWARKEEERAHDNQAKAASASPFSTEGLIAVLDQALKANERKRADMERALEAAFREQEQLEAADREQTPHE